LPKSGRQGKKVGCEQGRIGYQSQRSLLSGFSLPFIKKDVLVRRGTMCTITASRAKIR
jgi:hypothetical protein